MPRRLFLLGATAVRFGYIEADFDVLDVGAIAVDASAPCDHRIDAEIAVKRDAAGRGGSVSLVDEVAEGDLLMVGAPENLFALSEKARSFILVGGGVVANSRLRELAAEKCAAHGIELRIPALSLCTDNGAMIAALGAQLMMAGRQPSSLNFGADSTLPVTSVQTH